MNRTTRIISGAGLTAANCALALPVAYLGALTLIAWVVRGRSACTASVDEPCSRFVVLVPAHNEATTLPTLLSSLAAVDYPASMLTVHVVADNCEDDSASLASAAGAVVHERFDSLNPGKGPALNWLMSRLAERDDSFDAAVFVDADTSVSTDFLRMLDRRFRSGAVVVQGRYGVRDAFESPPAALRYCALACRHHLRPLARTAIGGSCGLFGNGMAMTRQLAMSRQWTDHLVEDMEFQVELFLSGIRVEYEPEAAVEAEMPHTYASSASQHERWELGRIDIARRYVPRLARQMVARKQHNRLATGDMVADLLMPPLSVVALAVVTSAALGGGAAALAPSRTTRSNAAVACSFTGILIIHVITALKLVGAPRRAYRALIHAPRLAGWKVLLLIRSLGTSDTPAWIRTRRNAEVAA